MIPWIHSLQTYTLLYLFLSIPVVVVVAVPLDLTDAQVNIVSLRLTESAQLSWELGTRAQAILERNATSYSVFSRQPLPPPSNPDAATLVALQPLFDMANDIVFSRSKDYTGPQPFMPDGSAGDPVSLVVCMLIANWTREANGGASRGLDYAVAAKNQIDYLFSAVPRTSDGALSHRVSELQLWSDFVYMVPPSLAYYGVMTRNRTMILEAYNQIRLYRNYLRDPLQGMWMHVLLGPSWNDPGFWSTGNGWAAAGMLRVCATIINSEYAPSLQAELADLAAWVQEIHISMYRHLDNNTYIFTNYADQPVSSPGNFYDTASTALLAGTVYRAAQFLGQKEYLPYAEKSRQALSAQDPATRFSYSHFTPDGALDPVVDPHSFSVKATTISPEGQAFVVQMHQAWKDWTSESTGGGSTGDGSTGGGPTEGGPTGGGPTEGVSTGGGQTESVSTSGVSTGGPTESVSTSGVPTGVVSMKSGSVEMDTPCAAVIRGRSGEQCTALLAVESGERSTALLRSKIFILVVSFTSWGLACVFA